MPNSSSSDDRHFFLHSKELSGSLTHWQATAMYGSINLRSAMKSAKVGSLYSVEPSLHINSKFDFLSCTLLLKSSTTSFNLSSLTFDLLHSSSKEFIFVYFKTVCMEGSLAVGMQAGRGGGQVSKLFLCRYIAWLICLLGSSTSRQLPWCSWAIRFAICENDGDLIDVIWDGRWSTDDEMGITSARVWPARLGRSCLEGSHLSRDTATISTVFAAMC